MAIFVGNSSAKAAKVKKLFIGNASDRAAKVRKVFIGDAEGKARLVYSAFDAPVYTGTSVTTLVDPDDPSRGGEISCLTSGELTLSEGVYDVFAVGAGASGSESDGTFGGGYAGGCGGGSGYTSTAMGVVTGSGTYEVMIGAGGVCASVAAGAADGGATTCQLGSVTAAGGKKAIENFRKRAGPGGSAGGYGSSYVTGSDGGESAGRRGYSDGLPATGLYGVVGQGTTTRAFGEAENTLYAGGGGGGGNYRGSYRNGYAGGDGGGGRGAGETSASKAGGAGTANTGGGGGGAYRSSSAQYAGGDGGSGLVIVRWGVQP